jgi:hypothetical protein
MEDDNWRITLIILLFVNPRWAAFESKNQQKSHTLKHLGWTGSVTCTAVGWCRQTARDCESRAALRCTDRVRSRLCPCPFIKRGLSFFFLSPCFESAERRHTSPQGDQCRSLVRGGGRERPASSTPRERRDNLHRESRIRLSRRPRRLLSVALVIIVARADL